LHDLTNSGSILSIAILRAFSRFSMPYWGIIAPCFAAVQISPAVQPNIAPPGSSGLPSSPCTLKSVSV
ncbi:MAG: hypothetical protein WA603_21890, partial [Candidatus Acidiferrales bacterium]